MYRSSMGAMKSRLPAVVVLTVVALLTSCTGSGQDGADVSGVSSADLAADVALLWQLERDGRHDELAELLDASGVDFEGGWAVMGNDSGHSNQRPSRQVYLHAFVLDRYEVTNAQFVRFVEETGASPPAYWPDGSFPDGAASHPVVGVSWEQANAYCHWAGGRLPTEAEWERACRGAAGSEYPWGDEWDGERSHVVMIPLSSPADAWPLLVEATSGTVGLGPVGEPIGGATPTGVCNLADNASEWVADWYDPDAYSTLPLVDPVSPGPTWDHVVRGGAWLFRHDDADLMIEQSGCTFRNASHSIGDPRIGFRCAADA